MMGGEELIFSGSYKDFRLGVRFELSGASEADVAAALSFISDGIEAAAYRFSEIDVSKIDIFAAPPGKGLKSVISFLNDNPQSKIKKELLSACPDPNLLPAAESCFFNHLLTKAAVPYKLSLQPSKPPEKEDVGDQVVLMGRFGRWMSIKKLSMENVADWEVSAILCGINHTAVNKAFEFSGINRDDKLIGEVIGGRKSFGNLLAALEKVEPKLPEDKSEAAYVVNKIFTEMGYPPYATLSMLVKAHKDVKPPKPKGRMPKG